MTIFISQGRYSREAIQGMIARPEDRAEAVRQLVEQAGGRLIGHYLTFGQYDFLVITEAPNEKDVAAALLAVASGGGVSELTTVPAMTSAEAKAVFGRAADLAKGFKSAGAG